MARLNGKKAIVTGAASGIGREIAIMLACEGADVLLGDVDVTGGESVRTEIVEARGNAAFMELDVSDEARWPVVIDYALAHFGGLDVLVNNAGVVLTKLLADTTLEDWRRVFRVNVEGVFLGTRYAMAVMKRSGNGSIINVTSTMASVPSETYAAYCASKAAATQFTKVAALNGAANESHVRVNSIYPGVISTPMIDSEIAVFARESEGISNDVARQRFGETCPLGMGEPKDIAYGVIYLASDESKYVTGSEMIIDGGHLIGGGA